MNLKHIIGIVVAVFGIAMILVANTIKQRVAAGELEISDAQRKVDRGNALFSTNPYSNAVGRGLITDPAQKKIDEGKKQVTDYTSFASRLQIGGIILIIAGIGVVLVGGKKRTR